ncbi:hypothetical protein BGZ60DRAFT_401477 [Tricladium varicosporioides]|nr:hypothetical protein BGZ60DRAFT_401477 [Hymenoscyphus varicosporioides]
MTRTIKNVILIGASGNIGTFILSALLSSSKFDISILTRHDTKSTFPAGVTVYKTDYSPDSLTKVLRGQDAVICALGHDAWSTQFAIIDAAVKAGVRRFIPSEYGNNTLNAKVVDLFSPKMDTKVQVLEYLKKQESKGMSWTGLATGGFFDWGLKTGIFGFNINTQTATIYDGGYRPFSVTNLDQVASAVVSILSYPKETANRYLYINSFTVTQSEILGVLETETGNKWVVEERRIKDAMKEGKMGVGEFGGSMLLLHASFLGEGVGADYGRDEVLANEMLGLPKQDLTDTVRNMLLDMA